MAERREPKAPTKALFLTEIGRYRSDVDGKPIEIVPWMDTFIFRFPNKTWSVTERTTGKQVGYGRTQKAAVEMASNLIAHFGKDHVLKLIATG